MGISVDFAFDRKSSNPIDSSLVLSKAEMLAIDDSLMPDTYFAVCKDDKKLYVYNKNATPSAETGKYSVVSGGGGGTESVELTQAQYDALSDEEKNNGTIYFVTDGQGGGGGGGSYVLPPATATTLGGIKVGNGLNVETDGTLSASGSAGLPTFTTTAIDGTDVYNGNVVKIGTINVRGTNPSSLEEEGIYRFYFETEDLPSAGSKTYNLSSLLQGYYIDKFISATGSTSNGEIFTFNQSDPTRVTDLNPTNKTLTVTFDGDIPGDILLEITFIGEEL